MTDILETIASRHSWRTYNAQQLDTATLDGIADAIKQATDYAATLAPAVRFTVHGHTVEPARPEIHLTTDPALNGAIGTYGFIKGARHYLILATGTTLADRLAGAIAMQHLILHATAAGLDTCWLGGTFSRKRFARAIDKCHPGHEIIAVRPIGHRAPSTRIVERVMRAAIRETTRKPFATLFKGIAPPDTFGPLHTYNLQAMSHTEKTAIALEAIRLAPSATNSQPWRTQTDGKGHITLSCTTDNAYTPLDMGIALTHFMLAADALGLDYRATVDTSASVPLITIATH